MSRARYVVRRCDEHGSIERDGVPVDHTWDVVDTLTGWSVRNVDTRSAARAEARDMNATAASPSCP